jgi:hypothetical protein
MEEGDECLQVTFLLDSFFEVGFRPPVVEWDAKAKPIKGRPIYFLKCKPNTIGDYECMFSEKGH